jgi:hypothetical protein
MNVIAGVFVVEVFRYVDVEEGFEDVFVGAARTIRVTRSLRSNYLPAGKMQKNVPRHSNPAENQSRVASRALLSDHCGILTGRVSAAALLFWEQKINRGGTSFTQGAVGLTRVEKLARWSCTAGRACPSPEGRQ